MTDPRRLLESESEALPAERDVLRAALGAAGPSAAQAEALKAALALRLPGALGLANGAAGGGAAAGAGGTATVGISGVLVKGAVTLALLSAGGLATWSAMGPSRVPVTRPSVQEATPMVPVARAMGDLPSQSTSTPTPTPTPTSTSTPTPTSTLRSTGPSLARSLPGVPPLAAQTPLSQGDTLALNPPPAPARAVAEDPEVTRHLSRLREESLSLEGVRSALRAGDVATARGRLAAHASSFPNGGLEQERRALEIEALRLGGDRAGARTAAHAFLKDYPSSPHAAAVLSESPER